MEHLVSSVEKRTKLDKRASASSQGTTVSSLSNATSSEIAEDSCNICNYKTNNEVNMQAHKQGHEKPKALINYKCVFCPWYSKKKQAVFDHMYVHTEDPLQYATEVEKKYIDLGI